MKGEHPLCLTIALDRVNTKRPHCTLPPGTLEASDRIKSSTSSLPSVGTSPLLHFR